MEQKITVEVCANSVESAIAAGNGGAGRIELCCSLPEGGITPGYGTIELTRRLLKIPVNVLIRPRGGDFLYSQNEFMVMKRDIEICKTLGVNGIVTGMLDESGNIDISRMEELVTIARPMEVTFHRAFDMCADPLNSLKEIIGLGIERILTSGQKNKAMEGVGLIAELVRISAGKTSIMAGSDINRANVYEIIRGTGVKEIHLSGKKRFPGRMKFKNSQVSMSGHPFIDEYSIEMTDAGIIKELVDLVRTISVSP